MSGEPAPISETARQALEQERADLRTEREKVAATLRDSDSDVGDQADAADELQRADDLRRLDDRIERITTRLAQAELAGPPPTDVVGVGSTVTVRFSDGTTDTVQIGEGAAVLDRTLVTADSPLGSALIGHRAGDTVDFEAPEGARSAVVVSLGD
ncbi:GreA/GreB family elongation factor [Streptomyces aureus]|uniref:GreA/GreB family elongation factor n=1 Tax=Streptomyces aureus TaxID=193461 RepID=UPI00055DF2D3|nr:GreA/GreB family elongation factor [Streptomyces aureus]